MAADGAVQQLSSVMFLRITACVFVALVGCQRSTVVPTTQPKVARSGSSMVVPDLRSCGAFAELPLSGTEDVEPWHRALDACSLVLRRRAAYIMNLFHAGDCDALAIFAGREARREEARFIAYLLDDLGDERGRALFLKMFPLDRTDPLDHVEALRGISQFLAPEEGCHPARCRAGAEPACSPWFGLEAPGACVQLRFGSADGCMPAYCMEGHEFLTLAARRNWDGAQPMLLRELANAGGYVWGSLCHCGVRGGIADRDAWEKLASGQEEMEALHKCFADMPGNTTASCQTVKDKRSRRVCGQGSASPSTARELSEPRPPH